MSAMKRFGRQDVCIGVDIPKLTLAFSYFWTPNFIPFTIETLYNCLDPVAQLIYTLG